jgi:hypothetical protein
MEKWLRWASRSLTEIYTSAIWPLIPIGLVFPLQKSARNGEFVVKNVLLLAERHQIAACFVVCHTGKITWFFTKKQSFSTF